MRFVALSAGQIAGKKYGTPFLNAYNVVCFAKQKAKADKMFVSLCLICLRAARNAGCFFFPAVVSQ